MNYTSGEFSKLIGFSVDTLRFYEKEGLINPERKQNGHRVYTDHDANWLRFIKRLKETGMSIKEIQRYSELRAMGDSTLQERLNMLVEYRVGLKEKIDSLLENFQNLDEKIKFYRTELSKKTI